MTELALDTNLSPEQRDLLDTARNSALSLLTLLNEVLDFSKIETHKVDLEHVRLIFESWWRKPPISSPPRPAEDLSLTYEAALRVPNEVTAILGVAQILVNLLGTPRVYASWKHRSADWRRIHNHRESLPAFS